MTIIKKDTSGIGWTSWIASLPSVSQDESNNNRSTTRSDAAMVLMEEQKQSDSPSSASSYYYDWQNENSQSYTLSRTGTIQQKNKFHDSLDEEEEEGLEIVSSPLSLDVWIQPTKTTTSKRKKNVSFSYIQIQQFSSSPSSPFTQHDEAIHYSIDHYESSIKPKQDDNNPIPYHLRHRRIPKKEELRQGNSLLDDSEKRRFRLPRLFTTAYNNKQQPKKQGATASSSSMHSPKYATSINMTGTVSEHSRTC
eukprot:scaffold1775_cov83-Cylindrotheca_fusiformis.AAC.4